MASSPTPAPCPPAATSWRKRWLLRIVWGGGILLFLLVLIPWVIRVWKDASAPSAPRLAYVLCLGADGPPGVKDFNSLPEACADPGWRFGATVRREWDGEKLDLEIKFSDQTFPFNKARYFSGTIKGWSPSPAGSSFNWKVNVSAGNFNLAAENEDDLLKYDQTTKEYSAISLREYGGNKYHRVLIRPLSSKD